jgi:hypothetical protein
VCVCVCVLAAMTAAIDSGMRNASRDIGSRL